MKIIDDKGKLFGAINIIDYKITEWLFTLFCGIFSCRQNASRHRKWGSWNAKENGIHSEG